MKPEEKEKTEDQKGTVYGPSGEVVQTDVSHGAHLNIEDKSGTPKWVRNGSDKDSRGAPIE